MNLTDLRAELDARATEADNHPTDLVAGTRRKIRRTKQRRIAGALGGTAVIALLVAGLVVPSMTSTAPDPADQAPADYVKDGVTFHGKVGDDRLDKAWIGKVGEGPLEFSWIPTTNNVVLRSYCRTTASTPKTIRIWVNDVPTTDFSCTNSDNSSPEAMQRIGPDDELWIRTPGGKPARVKLAIFDDASQRPGDATAQLGLGIYNSPIPTVDDAGIPVRIPAASPGDISKGGVRYRTKVGGDTLAAAAIGDPGQNSIQLSFKPTGAPLVLHSFCTANSALDGERYEVRIQLGNLPERKQTCYANSLDAATGFSGLVTMPASADPVQVTARVVGKKGEALTDKNALLALGIYYQGAQQVVTGTDGDKVSLNEVIETNGYNYKLADLKTADAATTQRLTIGLPTGKPYVLAVGSTKLGNTKELSGQVKAVPAEIPVYSDPRRPDNPDDFGLNLTAEPAGTSTTATLEITKGQAAKGKYILAVYLPMD